MSDRGRATEATETPDAGGVAVAEAPRVSRCREVSSRGVRTLGDVEALTLASVDDLLNDALDDRKVGKIIAGANAVIRGAATRHRYGKAEGDASPDLPVGVQSDAVEIRLSQIEAEKQKLEALRRSKG